MTIDLLTIAVVAAHIRHDDHARKLPRQEASKLDWDAILNLTYSGGDGFAPVRVFVNEFCGADEL